MMAFAGSITVSLLAVALFTQMPGWFFDPRVIPNGKDTAIFFAEQNLVNSRDREQLDVRMLNEYIFIGNVAV